MTDVASKVKRKGHVVAPRPVAKVTKERFAEAFGAVAVFSAPAGQGPISRWQLVKEIQARMSSSGGRPSLTGADSRMKVSILNEDVPMIEELCRELQIGKYSVSPAQVATILVHMALASFSSDDIRKAALTVAKGV